MAWLASGSWNAVEEASAMVLPSDSEGFSMVTIEALALGLPVVLADFGGIFREAVVPGATGWIFPVADTAALAEILQAIVDDPGILPEANTIRDFARKFSTDQMAVDFRRAAHAVTQSSSQRSY
jgi:UDP-D-galactose:(glucosyl)LPS alpha-1,6-D-galactosyltransferase